LALSQVKEKMMKATVGLVLALMLGGTGAYAQGGPTEKMQGAPSAREQGAGDAGMRGNDGGNQTPSREDKSTQPGSKSDRDGGKQAQENRDDKSSKGRSDKESGQNRANKDETNKGKPNDRAEDRSRSDKDKPSQTTQDRGAAEQDKSAEKKNTEPSGQQNKQATSEDKGGAKHVDLSGDKRDRVKTALREKSDIKHRTNVNIDVRIGTRLPRDFDLVAVPDTVIAIVPEYRGYLFAYVDDDYVICDPQTYEIVAVIPASGGGPNYASDHSSSRCSDQLSLSADQKDLVIRSISREGRGHMVDVRDLRPGWSVPRDVELLKFPDPVLDRVGELSSCRYFVAEDKIAIVSPDEEKVVLLIDRS
jgi:hypothetical protein